MTAGGAAMRNLKAIEGGKQTPNASISAMRTLDIEAEGIAQLKAALDNGLSQPFAKAVDLIKAAKGRIIVSGIGKSGHVGQKIAATFASTGTPAFFVHPSEASHGDLGMITRDDVILALSWSGETVELKNIITFSRRFAVPLISLTSREEFRPCPAIGRGPAHCHGLGKPARTVWRRRPRPRCSSHSATRWPSRCWRPRASPRTDFKVFHPGGSLGASLKYVSDVMHKGDRLPLARETEVMSAALVTMTSKSLGCLGIVDAKGKLIGVVTDGDLRRHMGDKLLTATTGEIMTKKPKTIAPHTLTSAALEMINASRITALFVVDKGKPVGVLHVHDLLRVGVA